MLICIIANCTLISFCIEPQIAMNDIINKTDDANGNAIARFVNLLTFMLVKVIIMLIIINIVVMLSATAISLNIVNCSLGFVPLEKAVAFNIFRGAIGISSAMKILAIFKLIQGKNNDAINNTVEISLSIISPY